MMARLAIVVLVAACGGTARGPDTYRTDTQKLLDTRSAALQSCYDTALKANDKLAGTVKVTFVVAKKTGAIANTTVEPSTPPALGKCVLEAINGLKLDPPDRDEGHATFVYEFKPSST